MHLISWTLGSGSEQLYSFLKFCLKLNVRPACFQFVILVLWLNLPCLCVSESPIQSTVDFEGFPPGGLCPICSFLQRMCFLGLSSS